MLKKTIAISNIITITFTPFSIPGNIIFNAKTIRILIISFKKISNSDRSVIRIQQLLLLFYSQMRLSKTLYFSILCLIHWSSYFE